MTFRADAASIRSRQPRTSRGSGPSDQVPFEGYWVGFTNGAIAYTLELFGRPGSVSEEQAQEIASAYHDRLTGG